jgi:cell division septation protein DedD
MNAFVRNSMLGAWLVASALLVSAPARAAPPAAVVEGVQMPAWVERGGRRQPIVPGMELKPGDRLTTGAGSRLLVKLSEGSSVKLGENGTLQLAELNPTKEIFKAALGVLEGAFRFTTDVLAKGRKREIDIRVATVTAGIRGTDLWGKQGGDKQIVCLIEGKIEVGAQGEAPVTMDQPRQFYQREKNVTAPVGMVDDAQLAKWALETEIEQGKGAARRGGKWKVNLLSSANQNDVLGAYDQVRAAGYGAQIFPSKAGEKRIYLLQIRGLPSKAEAQALAEQLKGKYGVSEPKVSS